MRRWFESNLLKCFSKQLAMKHQIYDITYTRHDGSEWTRTEGGETADDAVANFYLSSSGPLCKEIQSVTQRHNDN